MGYFIFLTRILTACTFYLNKFCKTGTRRVCMCSLILCYFMFLLECWENLNAHQKLYWNESWKSLTHLVSKIVLKLILKIIDSTCIWIFFILDFILFYKYPQEILCSLNCYCNKHPVKQTVCLYLKLPLRHTFFQTQTRISFLTLN